MSVLVVAEHRQGVLRTVSLELVTAAAALGPVTVLVIARDPAQFVDQLNLPGVSDVLTVSVEHEEFEADLYAQVLAGIVAQRAPSVVLVGHTVDAMSYAPGVAVTSGLALVTDVFAIDGELRNLVATRSLYSGKVDADVATTGDALLLVRPGAFGPAEGPGSASVSEVSFELRPSRTRHRSYVEPDAAGDVDIGEERFLLAIGRGIGERENIPVFQELARCMGATLASSRPLVDSGWMPSSRLVGQSGKVVKPAVYLAFGISGAIQHLAGMKTSDLIIAINTDPEASIFNVAQYGAVADVFDIAEALANVY